MPDRKNNELVENPDNKKADGQSNSGPSIGTRVFATLIGKAERVVKGGVKKIHDSLTATNAPTLGDNEQFQQLNDGDSEQVNKIKKTHKINVKLGTSSIELLFLNKKDRTVATVTYIGKGELKIVQIGTNGIVKTLRTGEQHEGIKFEEYMILLKQHFPNIEK